MLIGSKQLEIPMKGEGYMLSWKSGYKKCILPWRKGLWISGSAQQTCNNPDHPCDMCSCVGNPPKLQIDKDGCSKGKKCAKPCESSTDEHRAGDTWQCWIEDWK